ncbi:transcription factor MYB98-like [Vigna umbellata]|uniref:transcription factor MYB98-like n=1 Tax=Vigna umbellata TaxID=87088 RepID=UPI001F5EF4CB|nr:transcription factor MYB98-like [Vigna umbellata]
MDIETLFKETFVPQPLQESCLKDMIPLGNPLSQECLQDFHHIDQFHFNVPSSNNSIIQNPTFDAFENFTFTGSSPALDVYESKPFVENRHTHVMDNFLYGNHNLILPQRNVELDLMVADQSFLPFSPQEIKPSNFSLPDEVSCISPMNYYKRIGLNKNNKSYPTTRRTSKVRKKSNTVKGHWTIEEDGLLIQLVEQYGLRKWSHIAKILPGRIGKQCRERWHNHLRPDIKKDTWNCEDDKILIEAHAEVGNKWAEIAKRLPGRTENSIKNHWNATKRRQYSKRKCRSKYPRGTLLQEYIKSLNLDKNPPIDYRRKSSANHAIKTSTSKSTAPALPQTASQFSAIELPPDSDFNVVPDFLFGENLLEEDCSIHSLLDGVPCVPFMDNKNCEGTLQCDPMMEGMQHFEYVGIECFAAINGDENHVETDMQPVMLEVEVKKELDLVEMISQINSETFHV